MKFLLLLFLFALLNFQNCQKLPSEKPSDKINSAAVAFAYSSPTLQEFFSKPQKASIQGYFYFEESLAKDVVFGLDIEHFEGLHEPLRFAGADWMGLLGFTREGFVYLRVGSAENKQGLSSPQENWEFKQLAESLKAGEWYKMKLSVDFRRNTFDSLNLEGAGQSFQLDLSDYPLDYPGYIPFDKPTLSFYAFALRSRKFAQGSPGSTQVYFDDIEAGVWKEGQYHIVFSDGFEKQKKIGMIPISLPIIKRVNIPEKKWYLENEGAKLSLSTNVVHQGNYALSCQADLD